jgi:hypothetical protein
MSTIGEESPLTRFASRVRFPAHISHPAGMSDFMPRDDRSWEETDVAKGGWDWRQLTLAV